MFTGIIEEMGTVERTQMKDNYRHITFKAIKFLEGVSLGDSIAVNGVCLTVLEFSSCSFTAGIMKETLAKTNLNNVSPGDKVNLERALTFSDRINGHLVSGHVDHMGKVKHIDRQTGLVMMHVFAPDHVMKYIVDKGSIAIDGVSLTIVDFDREGFSVSLLPYSLHETTLGFRKVGDKVNLEIDLLAKFAEKRSVRLTLSFLEEHGYL